MQFNNPASTRNENKKHHNSTLKKINWTVISIDPAAVYMCFASGRGEITTTTTMWRMLYNKL